MALAKKCDRCGKLYEHYPTNDNNVCNAIQSLCVISYQGEHCFGTLRSKVYYVDPNRDRFLITDNEGYFIWVKTEDCKIWKGEENDD